jgi:hypothetical protein
MASDMIAIEWQYIPANNSPAMKPNDMIMTIVSFL